ncbi:MAG: thiamine-phosphate kinase, partial [Desulfovibrio sp. S3730MH75]
KLANKNGLILAGGDLCKGPSLGISVTVWGEPYCVEGLDSAHEGRFLTRGNAKPGDILFIHGSLGLARTGLLCLEKTGISASKDYPVSVQAHLRPEIRTETGKALSASPAVTGLMDLSDGLARDLPRFIDRCDTAFGAEISLPAERLHNEIFKYAEAKNISPEEHAFRGGEDYALFGAASADKFKELSDKVDGIIPIGTLTDKSEIILNGKKFIEKGFDHFSG